MGIPHLNKYMLEHCKKTSIKKMHLGTLKSKTILIDTSIYLYKFVAGDALLEHLYLLISIFRHYEIIPVFIFDGKPPAEKRQLLIQRRLEKRDAEEKYNELKLALAGSPDNSELLKELESLKRQCISITFDHLQIAKDLMEAYGVQYICAEGEADVLCAQMAANPNIWACMSDDMDMFVYGCPRVLRQLSLMNHNIMFYDTNCVLEDLEMDLPTFREIAVLSGTDYLQESNHSLHKTMELYKQYKTAGSEGSFSKWLCHTGSYIKNLEQFQHIVEMFQPPAVEMECSLSNLPVNMDKLKQLMEPDGFIFVQ